MLYAVGKEVPGKRFPVSALRFIRSTDQGKSWSKPVTVNDGSEFGSHNFHALTVAGDRVLLATWLDAREGHSGVWMSRSTDDGRTWQVNRPIYSEPTCPCCRTAVAVAKGGTIYVAWRAILSGDVRDVVVTKSTDGGQSWAVPVRPRADDWIYPGCPHAGPSLEVDAQGAVHVAWWTGKEGEAGVYYARSDDQANTFVSQGIHIGQRARPAHVQLAVAPQGRVYVAWDDGFSETPRVLVRRSQDRGRTFGDAALLSQAGVAASFPVLAIYGDSVAVAWSQTTAAEHHAKLAARMNDDPKATHPLPRVGQSEILLRAGKL